jgi:undecaprenyl-diphosphatase
MGIFEAVVLAIVESISEVMPVSGIGHYNIIANLLEINEEPFTPIYGIAIQFGIVAGILYMYWKRFTKIDNSGFFRKLILGALPGILFFILFGGLLEKYLLSTKGIAFSLIISGVFFLFIDLVFKDSEKSAKRLSRVSTNNSLVIGFWQCLGIFPGLGKTSAAIIGGLQQGLTRTMAAEFAYFISVPTLLFINVYKLLFAINGHTDLIKSNFSLIAIGNIISFACAVISIRFIMQFLQKFGFRYFGWYRIIAGFTIFYLISKGFL